MKKLFILLSTFFLSFFLAWIIVLRAPQYLYASYDSVSLLRVKKDTQEPTREVFEQELENFANSEQSLIARRIVEPSKDGTTHFTYATYGQGTLPKEFQEASQESRERSDPLNSYLLLSGSLTKEKLADKLGDLGYKASADRKIPPYFLAFRILLNPLILISLAIFGLSFFALVIITRIKEMRAAGIKLFSGQTLLSIMGHSLSTDIKWLLLSALLSFLGGGVVLFSQGLFYPILLATYGFGTGEEASAPLDYEMKAHVSYLSMGEKRFVYNNGENPVSTQYLTDPILVVFTPTSTGDSFISLSSWSINAGKQLFIKGYESGLELLKKAGIYEQVSYLKEGRSVYLTRYNEVQTETATLILGAIVGIASSLLLFYSVNLLYFEQFRRDILIKRISGLRFFETHAQYMVSQFASFVFGASLFILSSRDLVIGLLTLLVFLASAVLTLYRQAQKESRVSMTIMKGK